MAKTPTVTRNEIALSNGIKIEKTSITGAADMYLMVTSEGLHPLTEDDIEQLKVITTKKVVTRKVIAAVAGTKPTPGANAGQRKRYTTDQKLAIIGEIDAAIAADSSQAAVLRQADYPSANTVGLWRKSMN